MRADIEEIFLVHPPPLAFFDEDDGFDDTAMESEGRSDASRRWKWNPPFLFFPVTECPSSFSLLYFGFWTIYFLSFILIFWFLIAILDLL